MSYEPGCLLCGRRRNAGLLLCSRCKPESGYRQDARLQGVTAQAVIHEDGRIEYPPSEGGSTVLRGRIGSGKALTLDVREKRVRRRNRNGREEIESRIIDHVARIWIEEWRDAETGEVTYWRQCSLDDQEHHGAGGKSGIHAYYGRATASTGRDWCCCGQNCRHKRHSRHTSSERQVRRARAAVGPLV